MSYVVESGASSSRRARRRRALITLAVVALMLFFAFWYAYSYYRASDKRPAAVPKVTCTTAAAPVAPAPSKITVNVYNATNRDGLAAKTAAEVRRRGFKVSSVSNDPLQKVVAAAAEVRYGKTGAASGKVVAALVRGAKAVKDGRTDSSVDLVLGEKFTVLAPAHKATTAARPAPSATC
jgi:hypothetical protein